MDQIVRRRRTIQRSLDQRMPQRPSDRRWTSSEDALRCAASEEIVVFGCHHGRSPQPSPLVPRKVVATSTNHASGGHGRCNRLRLDLTRPLLLVPRAVTAATTLASRAATRRHRLGVHFTDVAWDRRSRLTTPLTSRAAGSRRRCSAAACQCSHLARLQSSPSPETLILRGLGCFYRRPNLVWLNRIARLTWNSSSCWKPRA
jgi:hypothetical protein